MAKKVGARTKLREFFIAHVGEVLDSDTLRDMAGISEWARRIRELRNVVERLIILSGERITKGDVTSFVTSTAVTSKSQILQDIFSKYRNIDDLINFVKKEYDEYMTEKV